ncbi:nucleoporin Nup2p [[Candida] anglica]|uniref:Nucleoporin Nup2p n=1 Tax=[Candida] anglica TaxID=148631 RepID=A0ABP0EDV7_9ASCO
MSKRQATGQITKDPRERDFLSSDDESQPVASIASADVLAKRNIIKPRSRIGAKTGGNAFGGVSGFSNNGFNGFASANNKPASTTTNGFASFGSAQVAPAPSITNTSTAFAKDPNEVIKALNEKFVQAIVKANEGDSVADFTTIAQKYIDYYKNLKGNNNKVPSSTTAPVSIPSSTPPTTAPTTVAAPSTKKVEKKPVESSDSESSDEEIKIEGPKFTLTSKPTAKNSPFSFGPKPAQKKDDSDSESEIEIKGPTFSFNKPIKDNVFKFKSADTTGSSGSFGTPVVDKKDEPTPKPAFSFNNDTKKDEPKPFSFGAPATEKKEETKPTFSFGAPAAEKKNDSKPAFSFGAPAVVAEKKDEAKPSFSFGAPATTEKKDDAKPAFSFGAPATTEKKDDAKPAFSFGAPVATEKKDEPKPAFSFGTPATEKKDDSKPAFSFGTTAPPVVSEKKEDSKPSFTFGAPATTGSKPALSFGAAASTESKPAFSFGSATKPASSFGESTPFSFGSSDQTKPAFSFGSKPNDSKPASAFNFASNGTAPTPTTNGSATADDAVEEEEANVNFTPVASLGNEKVDTSKTGEEDEELLYTKRAKLMLFVPSNKEQPYANKGLGELKVLKNNQTNKSRILVRADGGLRVLLNALVNKDVQYDTIGNGSMVRVPTVNADKSIETFILKVKTPQDGQDLLKVLNEAK